MQKKQVDLTQLQLWGKETVKIEIEALNSIIQFIDLSFAKACEQILKINGKVIIMGIGKSGHIGKKIAATLASTGTPSFFIHPGEANHGDLGMISSNDLVIAISNSGEANEILSIIPYLKREGIFLISITSDPKSSMASLSDLHICIKVPREACPLGLAPTSSTTATLVIGDAIAVALLQSRGFTKEDFALSHPGGKLGRCLLIRVSDLMHQNESLPVVNENMTIADSLYEMTNKKLGMITIIDENGILVGIFTDGDLRRVINLDINLKITPIKDVMIKKPICIDSDILASEALKIMETKKVNGLIIVDQYNKPIGALNMLDLVTSGVL